MQRTTVHDLLGRCKDGQAVTLHGWIGARRDHGRVIFLDVYDGMDMIQTVCDASALSPDEFARAERATVESAIRVSGILRDTGKPAPYYREVKATTFEVIGPATLNITPPPHGDFDLFDPHLQEHLRLHRHIYLRNPRVMAILHFRHVLMGAVHEWFRQRRFTEITAPILTPSPLYHDRSAISFDLNNQEVFLTQCVGFYLEWAAHAFGQVYNIGPSFRREESHSKRHLMEYWHIKAELTFGNLDDIIELVETLIADVSQRVISDGARDARILGREICPQGLNTPYPRLTYTDAIQQLHSRGHAFEFGHSLGSEEEAMLSEGYTTPFWVTGIPRSVEPFPYVISSTDPHVTMTADLIAPGGYGELLGVAEKIHDATMLDERMREKGKLDDPRYQWMRDLRQYGCVPHIGFGMGVERFIRWLLQVPHVRDTIPFARTFTRIHP